MWAILGAVTAAHLVAACSSAPADVRCSTPDGYRRHHDDRVIRVLSLNLGGVFHRAGNSLPEDQGGC